MALYLEHFGLQEAPFRITPHPDFFFDGAERGATLEALSYAILHDEGIVKVSGEIGSGKTMLCRVLMERLPAEVQTVFLANPSYSRAEILHAIADELNLAPPQEPGPSALRELQAHLIRQYAEGRRVVILIDEAHAMPAETLEQVRLLSNLESSRAKLLQIVLFGQPELDEALDAPSMRQLKDRITHSFRMRPLAEAEVGKYLSFRMRAAGYRGPDVFAPVAVAAIARGASGLTRRINVLADKSLLAAFAAGRHGVGATEVRAAIADSEFAPLRGSRRRSTYAGIGAALIAVGALAGAGLYWLLGTTPQPAVPPQQLAVAPPPAVAPLPPKPEPEPPKAEPEPVKAPAPLLDAGRLQRLAAYATGGQKLLQERVAATIGALQSQADERYALELFVTDNSDPARTERFLQRARDMVPLEELLVIPLPGRGRHRLHVLYGNYPDRAAALEAAQRLPPKYQRAFQAVPRSFAELREPL